MILTASFFTSEYNVQSDYLIMNSVILSLRLEPWNKFLVCVEHDPVNPIDSQFINLVGWVDSIITDELLEKFVVLDKQDSVGVAEWVKADQHILVILSCLRQELDY